MFMEGKRKMIVSFKIETNKSTLVSSYIHGILQQMKQNKHFLIKEWNINQNVELEKIGEKNDHNLIPVSDMKTAETINLFEKVYRDVNVALANEFALFCEKVGIDFIEVMNAANTQPYCHLPFPGIVSRLPEKDLLVEEAENVNAKLRMTILARKINDGILKHTIRLARDALGQCGKTLRRAKISILGVYPPDVFRNQGFSIKELVDMLHGRGVKVKVYDSRFSYKDLKELGYPAERTLTKTVQGADCLVIAVRDNKFKRLNLKRIKLLVRMPAAIVDMSRILAPAKAEKEGFIYYSLGRGVK